MLEANEFSRVLIVDGDRTTVEAMSLFLTHRHYDVATAGTVEEASSLLSGVEFDVIIADKDMLSVNNYRLIDQIKNLYRDIKLIVMSGSNFEEEDFLRRGAAGTLINPTQNRAFITKLNLIVKEKRKTIRFQCKDVACRVRAGKQEFESIGILNNISLDGALIESDQDFVKPDTLDLDFFSLGKRKKLCSVKGKIVRTIKTKNKFPFQHAVYFEEGRKPDLLDQLESCIVI